MNDISYKVALGGTISSLCLLAMFLTGVMPLLYLTLPMIAGGLIMVMMIEIDTRWAILTYIAVGLLSLFVTFDKEASVMFIMFFGHYPILKQYIERIKNKLLSFVCKLLVYNVCIVISFQITVHLFGITDMVEEFGQWGKYGAYIFLGITNIVFLTYDYALKGCGEMYLKFVKPKILRKK